jgi:hypothetical protein
MGKKPVDPLDDRVESIIRSEPFWEKVAADLREVFGMEIGESKEWGKTIRHSFRRFYKGSKQFESLKKNESDDSSKEDQQDDQLHSSGRKIK